MSLADEIEEQIGVVSNAQHNYANANANANPPQVVAVVGKAIMEIDRQCLVG